MFITITQFFTHIFADFYVSLISASFLSILVKRREIIEEEKEETEEENKENRKEGREEIEEENKEKR